MSTRTIGIITLFTATLTTLWGVMFLYTTLSAPTIQTLADQVSAIERQYRFFLLNYANAGFLTVACVIMFAGYYAYCKEVDPLWAVIALVFVPIYAVGNLVVYLSQVFVVPGLLDLFHTPETAAVAEVILGLTLHTWIGSITGFVNGLAYAALGIPSIIFGVLLYQKAHAYRPGGVLLAASGVLSIIALLGTGLGSSMLMFMSPVSGFVFLVGISILGVRFLQSFHKETISLSLDAAGTAGE
jgi:hypothetical protein